MKYVTNIEDIKENRVNVIVTYVTFDYGIQIESIKDIYGNEVEAMDLCSLHEETDEYHADLMADKTRFGR